MQSSPEYPAIVGDALGRAGAQAADEEVQLRSGPNPTEIGAYVVEATLGAGAMATVFAVRHRASSMPLAMKVLSADHAKSPQFRERFLRESVTARALASEHVVRVVDAGFLHTGQPYLVMERLFGTDLDTLLEERGPMPLSFVIDVALQAACALSEAHAAGIVHRDLKPANLFLARRPDGQSIVKVVDFGISKTPVTRGPALTQEASAMGSPSYMAPEQFLDSKNVDHRADIWSLGVTLFELLTGALPFQGASLAALAASILYDSPRKVGELRSDLPHEISRIIARCLSKDREARYASVHGLTHDLRALARSSAPSWDEDEKTAVFSRVSVSSAQRRMPAHRTLVFAVVVMSIALISMVLLIWSRA